MIFSLFFWFSRSTECSERKRRHSGGSWEPKP